MTVQSGPTYLFLDFDGVLRRFGAPPDVLDEGCLHALVLAVGPIADPRIVVTSTWRLAMSLAEIRQRFPAPLAGLIEGVTPVLEHVPVYRRFAEIHAYCTQMGIPSDEWVAIDDSPQLFPRDTRLVQTHPERGFDQAAIVRLWHLLGID